MKVKVCPDCGKHNAENAWNCDYCGATLSMRTLIDTDDAKSEIQQTLSEISPYFIQDVANVLDTVIQVNETVIWGCNTTQISISPPFRFGYLITTSLRLIRVQFNSETMSISARNIDSMGNAGDSDPTVASLLKKPWKLATFAISFWSKAFTKTRAAMGGVPKRTCLEVYLESDSLALEHSRSLLGSDNMRNLSALAVDYPKYPLTLDEEASRKIEICNLKELVSAYTEEVEEVGYTEFRFTLLKLIFQGEKEMTVTFYAPHHFEKVKKLLSPWLRKKTW